MKKIIIVAVLFLATFTAKAQENIIKVNPVGLAFGSAELSYERVISDKSALEISLAYSRFDVAFNSGTDKATGLGAEGKYKFYLSNSKSAPTGFYVAPVVTYAQSKANVDDSKGKVSTFAAGVLGGYQWVFGSDSGFSLDLNIGAQYASASTSGDIISVDIDGFLPRIGLGLGYAW